MDKWHINCFDCEPYLDIFVGKKTLTCGFKEMQDFQFFASLFKADYLFLSK